MTIEIGGLLSDGVVLWPLRQRIGDGASVLDVRIPPGAAMIECRDEDGRSRAGVMITLQRTDKSDGPRTFLARTGPLGRLTVFGLPSGHYVSRMPDYHLLFESSEPFEVPSEDTGSPIEVVHQVVETAGSVSGRVNRDSADTRVLVAMLTRLGDLGASLYAREVPLHAFIDDAGFFRFDRLPQGVYEVSLGEVVWDGGLKSLKDSRAEILSLQDGQHREGVSLSP
jgi:hypothetical protein